MIRPQSHRRHALWLLATGRAFPCACSRGDVGRAVSAPHDNEEGPRYPGTCRALGPDEVTGRARAAGRRPAIRFVGNGERIAFEDDFVLRRADGVAAYQLAVVDDDGAMAIGQVVRGSDLLRSTPRQIAIYRALDLPVPRFAHVPLVLAPGGKRLAKRTRPSSLAELRAAGMTPEEIIGALAASAGLGDVARPVRPRDLIKGFALPRVHREPVALRLPR